MMSFAMLTTYDIDLVVVKYFGSHVDESLFENFISHIQQIPNITIHIHDNTDNNIGLSKARNLALQSCTKDIVCFSDFDVKLKNIHWDAISNKLLDLDVGIISPITTKFSTSHRGIEWQEKTYIACNMMFMKSDFIKSIGGFDERFFVAYGDWDLIKRVQSHNLKILQHNFSVIDHYGASRFNYRKNSIWRSDFQKFINKWGNTGVLDRRAK